MWAFRAAIRAFNGDRRLRLKSATGLRPSDRGTGSVACLKLDRLGVQQRRAFRTEGRLRASLPRERVGMSR